MGSYLCLHVAGKDGLGGLIEISHVATRDELFELIREDLAIDISEAEGMDIVRIERTDTKPNPCKAMGNRSHPS